MFCGKRNRENFSWDLLQCTFVFIQSNPFANCATVSLHERYYKMFLGVLTTCSVQCTLVTRELLQLNVY